MRFVVVEEFYKGRMTSRGAIQPLSILQHTQWPQTEHYTSAMGKIALEEPQLIHSSAHDGLLTSPAWNFKAGRDITKLHNPCLIGELVDCLRLRQWYHTNSLILSQSRE